MNTYNLTHSLITKHKEISMVKDPIIPENSDTIFIAVKLTFWHSLICLFSRRRLNRLTLTFYKTVLDLLEEYDAIKIYLSIEL